MSVTRFVGLRELGNKSSCDTGSDEEKKRAAGDTQRRWTHAPHSPSPWSERRSRGGGASPAESQTRRVGGRITDAAPRGSAGKARNSGFVCALPASSGFQNLAVPTGCPTANDRSGM